MKLSLVRKLGFVHVSGSRLLRLAIDQQVRTGTQNALDTDLSKSPVHKEPWVTAKAGDLAAEMVAVKTGNVVGYSYLTGDAIGLNMYRDKAPEHWFTPARLIHLDVASPSFVRILEQTDMESLVRGLMTVKYDSMADVVTFEGEGESKEAAQMGIATLTRCMQYVPADMTDEQARELDTPLFVGLVHFPKKGKGVAACCNQPARYASKYAPNGFQLQMLVDMEATTVSPWDTKATAAEAQA